MAIHLVLGGARSGKSAYAERAATAAAGHGGRVYIATAEGRDAEMAERIAHHRQARDDGWRAVEAPLLLPEALLEVGEGEAALVDCLTLWLSNSMLADDEGHAARLDALLLALERRRREEIWLVSNEVGWGIVPDNALARRFRDEAGRLNQAVAALADEAVLVAAGLAMRLK